MRHTLLFQLICLSALVTQNARAVVNPQILRDATPEVLVCCLNQVQTLEGEEVSAYSAVCSVRAVIRSSLAVKSGDALKIAYEVVHSLYDKPHSTDPGPAFPTPPPPIRNGDLVTAYLHRSQDEAGHAVYVPHIGIDSFEPYTPESGTTMEACEQGD